MNLSLEQVSHFFTLSKTSPVDADDYYRELISVNGADSGVSCRKADQFHILARRLYPTGARKFPFYYYMITFTLDPKKNKFNDLLYDTVEKYIKKILVKVNKKYKPFYVQLVREGGDDDHKHTHWHACVVSETCFDSTIVSYYQQKYGNIDISTNHSQNIHPTIKYMSKQSLPISLLHSELVRNLDPNSPLPTTPKN